MINISSHQNHVDKIEAQLLAVPVFSDNLPLSRGPEGLVDWRLNGFITKLFQNKKFHGNLNEKVLIPVSHGLLSKKVLLIGLGEKQNFDLQNEAKFWATLVECAEKLGAESIALPTDKLHMKKDGIQKCLNKVNLKFKKTKKVLLVNKKAEKR